MSSSAEEERLWFSCPLLGVFPCERLRKWLIDCLLTSKPVYCLISYLSIGLVDQYSW